MNATLDSAEVVPASSGTQRREYEFGIPAAVGVTLVALAIGVGLVTFTILTGLTPVKPTEGMVIALLAVNAALVLAMVALVAWQVVTLLRAKSRQIAGARLHVRIVSLFSIVAALPAIVVAIFASVTLDRGLDTWFSDRTRAIVDTAVAVAQAYVREHGSIIRADVSAMANDLGQAKSAFDKNRPVFERFFTTQTALRGLHASFLINKEGIIQTRSVLDQRINYEVPPAWALNLADRDKVAILNPGRDNMVRALVKLKDFENAYLYVHRFIDELVVEHLRKTQAGKAQYDQLLANRSAVQLTFGLMYIGVSLIFLLAAIWFGFWVADRIVRPIVRLVDAARSVSRGQLDVKVPVRRDEGDLATLGRTFNNMTGQLRSQRDELVDANTKLDQRRRFTEAVLSGVTAGVFGLDKDGIITLVNRAAPKLLAKKERDLLGKSLSEAVPEMGEILDRALSKASGSAEGHITLGSADKERNFLVRVTTEQSSEAEHGYVVTFDDMSELVTAQRNSAWADIARRIAHEIKNPLTPIQLSAERLKRKYQKEISTDPSVFEQCTDTIIRQVGDIGRMVDEFSTFARMPKAVIERQNLVEIVKEAMVLQRVGSSGIAFSFTPPEEPVIADIDRRLVTQAITNLIKNATEAIEARQQPDADIQGQIDVSIIVKGHRVLVDVADNGKGLPKENRSRLVEPYMTTREKGTGLGLAIVKKIMEEHGGRLTLQDAPADDTGHSGALVRLEFPLAAERSEDEGKGTASAKTTAEPDAASAGTSKAEQ